ncbi:MAG: hypothetical protein RI925_2204, partial [Pseudomonadota bacterium]
VGPRLQRELEDRLLNEAKPYTVHTLIPGLSDPVEHGVHPSSRMPSSFTGFVSGRLDDDRIKQGRLALRAFAQAVAEAREHDGPLALARSPRMRMMGIDPAQEDVLLGQVQTWAGGMFQVDLLPYSEDRAHYFRQLAGSSVALMPSWHEGFGLTGWEAIGAGVPLILGSNSGLWEWLRDTLHGSGENHSLFPLQIRGHYSPDANSENHHEQDLQAVKHALRRLANDPEHAKQAALRLRDTIQREGWDWRHTAEQCMSALALPRATPQTQAQPATATPTIAPPPATASLPDWLRPPEASPWQPELGLAPSRLLQAANAIVPFHSARQPLLDNLLDWARRPQHPVQVRLYTGAGGSGKTRLALAASQHLAKQGWTVAWLGSAKPADWLAHWQTLLRQSQPLCLVVDYAEHRASELDALLSAAHNALGQPSMQVRVLLLARSAHGWWADLCRDSPAADLLNGPATEPVRTLPDLRLDNQDRHEAYQQALAAYAHAQRRPTPSHAFTPPMEQAQYARPLYLHLAALAALDSQRATQASSLLESQLHREWRYWKTSDTDTRHDDWADALAWLALVGGAPRANAEQMLSTLGLPHAAALATQLARAYPAAPGAIAALQPDLLAETLLAQRLAGERGLALLQQALSQHPEAALATLGRLCADTRRPASAHDDPGYAATLLHALLHAFPSQGQMLINAAHASEPGLGRWLARAWAALDDETQQRLSESLQLPKFSVCLLELTVSYRQAALRAAGEDANARAQALNNLAVALNAQGGAEAQQQALAYARESMETYRQLAASQAAAYLPDLASSLNNLANHLSAQGDAESRRQALDYARESMEIRRQLAASQAAAYLPDLALSLNNLAVWLGEQGDAESRRQALAYARESMETYRQLAASQPAAYLPNLALSLNNLAVWLGEQGDAESRQQALAYAREAMETYRQLAASQAAAYLPDLAMSLNTLANCLSEQGDAESRQQALAYARESMEIYRQLAASQAAAYLPNLAVSLNNLAVWLSEQGDAESRRQALAYARESMEIRRQLAASQPAAYLPDLAGSLNTLATCLSEQGDAGSLEQALHHAREAVTIFARCYASMPAAFEYRLNIARGTLLRRANALGLDGEAEVSAALHAGGIEPGRC